MARVTRRVDDVDDHHGKLTLATHTDVVLVLGDRKTKLDLGDENYAVLCAAVLPWFLEEGPEVPQPPHVPAEVNGSPFRLKPVERPTAKVGKTQRPGVKRFAQDRGLVMRGPRPNQLVMDEYDKAIKDGSFVP